MPSYFTGSGALAKPRYYKSCKPNCRKKGPISQSFLTCKIKPNGLWSTYHQWANRARFRGRNDFPSSLAALSLFKGTPAKRVSLLSRKDTTNLVRLAEATCGHPFLTQHLCDKVWENLYDDDPDAPPTVTVKDVETAIHETLDARMVVGWLATG
ncbi:MAG: hypothetical protein ABFS56_03995 [Pseudomonadota bacterium]